jgi:hypothetical protein
MLEGKPATFEAFIYPFFIKLHIHEKDQFVA